MWNPWTPGRRGAAMPPSTRRLRAGACGLSSRLLSCTRCARSAPGGMRALAQAGPQRRVSAACVARAALAGTLVTAGAHADPQALPHGTSEGLRRMRADLGRDGVGRRAADAGDRLQQVQFVPVRLKGAPDTLVEILDALRRHGRPTVPADARRSVCSASPPG